MAGNREGGLKAKQKLIDRLGEDGYKEHLKKVGSKGGKAGFGEDYKGGFASSHELAVRAGKIGGLVSRRKPKIAKDINDVMESGILG